MLKETKELLNLFSLLWHHKLLTIAGVELSLGSVLVALTLLLFATRLSRMVSRIINRRLITPFVDDPGARNTYQTFAFYGSLALVVTLSLTVAGIPLTVFTVLGGALAIGVGFGSQNVVNNFISGIILLVEQPVKVGDGVTVDNMSGSILTIGTRSTKIRNADNKVFIVPNSFLLEKAVLNNNFHASALRNVVSFGVAYGTDVKFVENLCMDIMLNHDDIVQAPLPQVVFENFGESDLKFQMIFYSENHVNGTVLSSQIRYKIYERFNEHKIVMPYPHREVYLKLDSKLESKMLS